VRKRIVIGLLILSVIGIAAFFFSQPKKGSVEWHKRKYVAALDYQPLVMRAHNLWRGIRGKPDAYVYFYLDENEREKERRAVIERHQRALIDAGYFERREFPLSNRTADEVLSESYRLVRSEVQWRRLQQALLVDLPFRWDADRGTNVLIIVAAREDMPTLAETIRKADVP
jgi:hypothetical protein